MRLRSWIIAAVMALAAPATAAAQPLETYQARLSNADHYNSNGQRLWTIAGIIRQDRANYFKFGIRDAEDESDSYFANQDNRQRLEILLLHGHVSRAAKNAILYGTPLIHVTVYDDYVDVMVEP